MNRIILVILIALACLSEIRQSRADEKAPAPQPPAAVDDAQQKIIWDSNLTAHINERYWSTLAEHAAVKEWRKKFWAIVVGAVAFALSILPRSLGLKRKGVLFSIDLASLAAFALSLILFVNYGANYDQLSILQKRWSSLSTEWQDLWDRQAAVPKDQLEVRIQLLESQAKQITECEPPEKDSNVMHLAWLQEMHARDLDKWAESHSPPPAANAN